MNTNNQTKFSTIKLIASIILPLLAVAVPIAFYFIQLEKKSISYEIISASDLLAPAKSVPDEFEVSFLGDKLKDLFIINIRVMNDGDIPIKREDFDKSLNLDFGQDSLVLKALIEDKMPSNLPAEIKLKERFIEIAPLLLNSGDYFTIKAFATGIKAPPILETRITGIKEPKLQLFKKERMRTIPDIGIYLITILLMFVYSFQASLFLKVKRSPKFKIGSIYKIDLFVLVAVNLFAASGLLVDYVLRTDSNFFSIVPAATIIIPIGAGVVYQTIRFKRLQSIEEKPRGISKSES